VGYQFWNLGLQLCLIDFGLYGGYEMNDRGIEVRFFEDAGIPSPKCPDGTWICSQAPVQCVSDTLSAGVEWQFV